MNKQNKPRSIREAAMDLLARREHSAHELAQKLRHRGFDNEAIDAALEQLQQERLQSDSRFIESMINHRVNAGFGPIKIKHELRLKGVDTAEVDNCLSELAVDWEEMMSIQRNKKFGQQIPADNKDKMRQARFLQNRGFSPESVMRLLRRATEQAG